MLLKNGNLMKNEPVKKSDSELYEPPNEITV